MIYLYLFGTCFHFIYVFMIIENKIKRRLYNKHVLLKNVAIKKFLF